MFLVPTYLAASRIHGLGVYSPNFIPAGSILWEFNEKVDWRMKPGELDEFPFVYREQLKAWAYLDEDGCHVFCGDNAKFMNHEDDPNCNDSGPLHTIAARDIQPGEELTCDYRLFDEDSKRMGQASLHTPLTVPVRIDAVLGINGNA